MEMMPVVLVCMSKEGQLGRADVRKLDSAFVRRHENKKEKNKCIDRD